MNKRMRALAARNGKANGFTLVELMIVVAVLAILASIGYPSYQKYMYASRRAEAQSELLKIQLGLEKWRANNNSYTTSLANAGFTDTNTYYNYDIINVTASTYTIRATAQGTQTGDTGCTPVTLTQSAVKGPSGCWKGVTGT
jgi:type IV pilus assembly protein PilE